MYPSSRIADNAYTADNGLCVNAGILDLSSIDFYHLDNIFEPRLFEFVVDSTPQTPSKISDNSHAQLEKKITPQTTFRQAKKPRSANMKFTLELLADKISNIEARLSAIERTKTEKHCGCTNTSELITELRIRAAELRSFLL